MRALEELVGRLLTQAGLKWRNRAVQLFEGRKHSRQKE